MDDSIITYYHRLKSYLILKGSRSFVMDSIISSIVPQSLSNSIQVADVNNDGHNDIIYSGYDPALWAIY